MYTPENEHFETKKNGGLVQMIFLFNLDDFHVNHVSFLGCMIWSRTSLAISSPSCQWDSKTMDHLGGVSKNPTVYLPSGEGSMAIFFLQWSFFY